MDGKAIRNKLVGSDDERAVSPVIGVILMVAITVILAAVIATLVMDFGESVDRETNAGADIEQINESAVSVTWVSEGNANGIVVQGATCGGSGNSTQNVGGSVVVDGCDTNTSVSAVAFGDNGNTTVATHTMED